MTTTAASGPAPGPSTRVLAQALELLRRHYYPGTGAFPHETAEWLAQAESRLRPVNAGSGSLVFVDDATARVVVIAADGGERRNFSPANRLVHDAMYRLEVPELGFRAADHLPRMYADTAYCQVLDLVPDAVPLDLRHPPGTSLPAQVYEPLTRFMVLTGTAPIESHLASMVAQEKGWQHRVPDVFDDPGSHFGRQLRFFHRVLTERLPAIAPALAALGIDVKRDLWPYLHDGSWQEDGLGLGLAHRDLHGMNVLLNGGVHVVDSETNAFGHPLNDLAYFLARSPRPSETEEAMLRCGLSTLTAARDFDKDAAVANFRQLQRLFMTDNVSLALAAGLSRSQAPPATRDYLDHTLPILLDRSYRLLFPDRDRSDLRERFFAAIGAGGESSRPPGRTGASARWTPGSPGPGSRPKRRP